MTRRQQDVALLLGSIQDAPFAQPKTWTGQLVARNAKRGELPANRVPCPACDGTKERRVRGVLRPCDRCLSEKGVPRGWEYQDLMIRVKFRRPVGSTETGTVTEWKTVPCDVCGGEGVTLAPRYRGDNNRCLRCGGSGRDELTLQQWRATRTISYTLEHQGFLRSGDPVLDCLTARQRSGSYDELLLCLGQLHEAWPALFRLVRDRYVQGQALGSARLERLAEEGGLVFLETRMPERIRVPGWVRERARRLRNEVAA